MKTCTKCKCEKSIDEFSLLHPAKKDGKYRPDCKECVRLRSRKAYISDPAAHNARVAKVHEEAVKKAQEFVANYLAKHTCVDCGEIDLDVLDFDHVRGVKVCDVSRMVNCGYRFWRIEEEIAKSLNAKCGVLTIIVGSPQDEEKKMRA